MMTGTLANSFFYSIDTFLQEVKELAHAKAMLLPSCENFSSIVPFKQGNHFSEMLLLNRAGLAGRLPGEVDRDPQGFRTSRIL